MWEMGKQRLLRSRAVHFVSDLTTVFFNPISDEPSKPPSPPPSSDDLSNSRSDQLEPVCKDTPGDIVNGPDTSSFPAFLHSLLDSSESGDNSNSNDQSDEQSNEVMKENSGKTCLLSKGKKSFGQAIIQFARVFSFWRQENKDESESRIDNEDDPQSVGVEMRHLQRKKEPIALYNSLGTSEPSKLLSEKMRNILYASLPALSHGRRWLLLYSTWRNGISLATLYRKSMICPGLSLLVVGDRKGAVFGGLVEAPLKPNNRRYQGSNTSFVFTNKTGDPVIYRPTGVNRYFTLCLVNSLAVGGGGGPALCLDGDLLNGSSSVSETYDNPCLAQTEDFEVKEVELWGFVNASKYEEMVARSQEEAPGICRW